MGHFKRECKECGRIVAQCRCPGPKSTEYVTCDECKKKVFEELSDGNTKRDNR